MDDRFGRCVHDIVQGLPLEEALAIVRLPDSDPDLVARAFDHILELRGPEAALEGAVRVAGLLGEGSWFSMFVLAAARAIDPEHGDLRIAILSARCPRPVTLEEVKQAQIDSATASERARNLLARYEEQS